MSMHRYRLYLTILCTFYLSIPSVFAQDYTVNVKNISVEDGLLHREIQTLFEDSNGLLWLGLPKGLQQYDGQDFHTWTKADKTGLLYYITAIGEDDKGWLWLYNNDLQKLVFIHSETKEILTAEEKFALDGFINGVDSLEKLKLEIRYQIPKNSKGQLCFGSFNHTRKIYFYGSENGFQSVDVDVDTTFVVVAIDESDNYWLSTTNSNLIKVDQNGNTIKKYFPKEDEQWGGHHLDKRGNFYFYLNALHVPEYGYGKIDTGGNLIRKFLPELQRSRLSIGDDLIWANTNKTTLDLLNFHNLEPITSFHKNDYHISLFDNSHAPYKDSRGMFWVYGKSGINKVEVEETKFRKYLSFKEEDKPFITSTRGFVVNSNSIYANLELSKSVKIDKAKPNEWEVISEESWARPLMKRSDNEYLIGYPFRVISVDSTGQVKDEYESLEGEKFSGSWSMYEDQNGKLWIGSGDELVYKNANENVIRKFEDPESLQGIKNKRGAIQNMILRADGKVWFCSWIGLFLFDPVTEKVIARYGSDASGDKYLPADKYYYIYQDDDGFYWVGTGEGLIKWKGPKEEQNSKIRNANTEEYKLFTRSDGFSNDVIYAIFEDEFDRLWMSSDYGIMSMDKETYDVQAYLLKDGISHQEFNRTAQFQEEDGTIYFGGLNGITSFHPKDFVDEEKSFSNLLITGFEKFDGEEQKLVDNLKGIQELNEIEFYPNDRFFRIKFVLPTFQDKSQILYAWKVDGVDENWNYQKENSLQIGILPYGNYTLRIKGQSGGGGWSPHELAIKVNVHKPFYLKLWFILLLLGSLIGIIWLFFKQRTSMLEREIEKATTQIEKDKQTIADQAEDLRKLDKLKSRFFANVSHELRTPLTLMLGPIKNLIKSNGHNEKDRKLLGFLEKNTLHLRSLVSEILDLSKLENNKMELEERPIDFYAYLRDHMSQFYSFSDSKGVNFTCVLPKEERLILNIDKKKFEKVINNFLSNAMKFTSVNGSVEFKAVEQGNEILISVKDSGSGISKEDLPHVFDRFYQSKNTNAPLEGGTGIGLSLCKELANLMSGKVWAESVLGAGSTFYFKIPKNRYVGDSIIDQTLQKNNDIANQSIHVSIPGQSTLSKKYAGAKILIAEDNAELREYYKIILSDYQVFTCENGKLAIDYLNENNEQPHLIISDLMMPVMDGMQFLTHLKENKLWRNIPVIMLTAKTNRLVKLKALRIGIDDYLTKPFDEEELDARISNLLDRFNARAIVAFKEPAENQSVLIPDEDKKWLEEVENYILDNISSDILSVNAIARKFNMSESSLLRQLKKITGLTPTKYLQEHKLNYSRELLEQQEFKTIAEVAYRVGFKDAKSFTRSFKQRFGKTPSSNMY